MMMEEEMPREVEESDAEQTTSIMLFEKPSDLIERLNNLSKQKESLPDRKNQKRIERRQELEPAKTKFTEEKTQIQEDQEEEQLYEALNTLQELDDVCQRGRKDIKMFLDPPLISNANNRYHFKIRMEEFKKSGVKRYAVIIRDHISGLIKYAGYEPTLFKLEIMKLEKNYVQLYEDVMKAQGEEAIYSLNRLIIATDIVMATGHNIQHEIIYQRSMVADSQIKVNED